MATKSVRAAVMRRVADLIRDEVADADVLVDVGWFAGEAKEEQVLVIGCEQDRGGHTIAAMSAATRGPRADDFDVVVYLETKREGLDAVGASERLEELWQAVELAMAKHKTLAATQGGSGLDGVVDAEVVQFTGPDLAATDVGHWARGEGRIQVRTRLS